MGSFSPRTVSLSAAGRFSFALQGVDLFNYVTGRAEVKFVRPYSSLCTGTGFIVENAPSHISGEAATWNDMSHSKSFAALLASVGPGDTVGVCVNGIKLGEGLKFEYDLRTYALRMLVLIAALVILVFVLQSNAVGVRGLLGLTRASADASSTGMCVVCWGAPRQVAYSC